MALKKKNAESHRILWFDKKVPRAILTIAFTCIPAILCGLISVPMDDTLKVFVFVFAVIFIILQVIFSLRCTNIDKLRELTVDEMERKIKIYQKYFQYLPPLLFKQAKGLNHIAKDITTNGIVSENRWAFDNPAIDEVCESIARFIEDYTKTSINVYYVRTINDVGTRIKMVGCSNQFGDAPKINGVERDVVDAKDTYFDIQMFAMKKIHAEYRLTADEVDKVFYYDDREKESGRIEQFLFIPVSCDKQNMIGLIEILVAAGSRIAENEYEMQNIQKLLRIYSSIIVLLHKAEKAAIALPPSPIS